MATRIERCKCCQTQLRVPIHAQAVSCPVCKTVITLVQYYSGGYTVPATGQYNGYNYGYYQQPLQTPPQGSSPPVQWRRRAVLCGVTYYGQPNSLQASLNNVRLMQDFLVNRMGFPSAYVLVLTEYEHWSRIPTKYNIQMAMRWLINGCQWGDSLVFYYTGHASQERDYDGDEIDELDEAVCPVDYKTTGKILDDEINDTIVRPLPYGAKLHAIFDTCTSGTLLDSQFTCQMNPEGNYTWHDHRRNVAYKGTSGGIARCFSACDDNQSTGDTTAFTGYATGALTFSFIEAVQKEPNLTYGRLLYVMRNIIRQAKIGLGIYGPFESQEPLLSSSETFDINSERFMI